MSPPEKRQPPQREIDQRENDPRVESRYGQQVRQPAPGVRRAEFGRDAAPLARRHGLDDGRSPGAHRQPGEPFDRPAVQARMPARKPFEKRPLRNPQGSGVAPPRHQAAIAFRTAAKRPHRAPAADALPGMQPRKRIGV